MSGDYIEELELVTPRMKKRWAERKALLRVARAAEDAWPFMFKDIPKALNSKRAKYEKLYEALKALPEGLLNDQ